MINYSELRKRLDSSPADQWERIVSDAIERDSTVEEKLKGQTIGFSVDDVVVGNDVVEATAYYVMLGDPAYNENGDYQDDDGESYDQEEIEYTYYVTISPDGTRWEED